MKRKLLGGIIVCTVIFIFGCGGGSKEGSEQEAAPPQSMVAEDPDPMEDKGIGPITSIVIPNEIDMELARQGEDVYNSMCTACHKPDSDFIGPSPKGIMDRRTPEWVMNMILNPEEMTQKNKIAKDLLIKFNGAPMINQSLTEEQARAVLEYFRTL